MTEDRELTPEEYEATRLAIEESHERVQFTRRSGALDGKLPSFIEELVEQVESNAQRLQEYLK